MKMGIERVLNENFSNLTSVTNIDESSTNLTTETVKEMLEKLLPAIQGLGGELEVLAVEENGSVILKFQGPARLKKGVELVLKDNKSIKTVVFQE